MTMTVQPSSLTFLQAIDQIYYSIWLVRKLVSMVVHKILYYFIDIKGIGLYSFLWINWHKRKVLNFFILFFFLRLSWTQEVWWITIVVKTEDWMMPGVGAQKGSTFFKDFCQMSILTKSQFAAEAISCKFSWINWYWRNVCCGKGEEEDLLSTSWHTTANLLSLSK